MIKRKTLFNTLFSNKPNCLSLNLLLNTPIIMNYLTIAEVFEHYPVIKAEFQWTEQDIQEFFESKLLIGKMDKGVLLISKKSIEDLIEYRKNVGQK